METLKKILKVILKVLFRLFIICLWACTRVSELFFKQVNVFLQSIISKSPKL